MGAASKQEKVGSSSTRWRWGEVERTEPAWTVQGLPPLIPSCPSPAALPKGAAARGTELHNKIPLGLRQRYITLKRDKRLRNSGEILRWRGSNLCVQFSSTLEVSEVKMKTERVFPHPLSHPHWLSILTTPRVLGLPYSPFRSLLGYSLSICCVPGITLGARDEHR